MAWGREREKKPGRLTHGVDTPWTGLSHFESEEQRLESRGHEVTAAASE